MSTTLLEASAKSDGAVDGDSRHDEATSQIVSFRLGAEVYGVDIMHVQEIILIGPVTPMPSVPDYIRGLTNLRGNVIPIIDLGTRFGLERRSDTGRSRIVVLNVGRKTMGVVVDAVEEVLRLRDSQIEPVSSGFTGVGREFINGLAKLEDRLVIQLCVDRMLDTEQDV